MRYLYAVPATDVPVRGQLMGFIRTLSIRNLNTVAGDYIEVSFDTGESFRLNPLDELRLRAEDCSSDSNQGKISSAGITITGNAVHTVAIRCNYTYYSQTTQRAEQTQTR